MKNETAFETGFGDMQKKSYTEQWVAANLNKLRELKELAELEVYCLLPFTFISSSRIIFYCQIQKNSRLDEWPDLTPEKINSIKSVTAQSIKTMLKTPKEVKTLYFTMEAQEAELNAAERAIESGIDHAGRTIKTELRKRRARTEEDHLKALEMLLQKIGEELCLHRGKVRAKTGLEEKITSAINSALKKALKGIKDPQRMERERNILPLPMAAANTARAAKRGGELRDKQSEQAESIFQWAHSPIRKEKLLVLEDFTGEEMLIYTVLLKINRNREEFQKARENPAYTSEGLHRTSGGFLFKEHGGKWVYTETTGAEENTLTVHRDLILDLLHWPKTGQNRKKYNGQTLSYGQIVDQVFYDLSKGKYIGLEKQKGEEKFRAHGGGEDRKQHKLIFEVLFIDMKSGGCIVHSDPSNRIGRKSAPLIKIYEISSLLRIPYNQKNFSLLSLEALTNIYTALAGNAYGERLTAAVKATKNIMLAAAESEHYKAVNRPLEDIEGARQDWDLIRDALSGCWGDLVIDSDSGTWTATVKNEALFDKTTPKQPKTIRKTGKNPAKLAGKTP